MQVGRDRWIIPSLQALVAIGFVVRLGYAAQLDFNFDEQQALHASWSVANGLVPYRDFWENHTPLLYYLLAPLLGTGVEGPELLYLGRGLMFVLGGAIFALTFALARLLLSRRGSWTALVLLGSFSLFRRKVIEIRPDIPYLALFLSSLLVLLRAPERGRNAFWAGVLLGVGFDATPKALFALAGVLLGVLCAGRGSRASIVLALRYLLGFLAPIAALVLLFAAQGALGPLLRWTIAFNFTVPFEGHTFHGLRSLLEWHLVPFLLLGALGLGGVAWSATRRGGDGRWLVLAVLTAMQVGIFVWVLPRPFPHSALPFCPLLALTSAWLIERTGLWLVLLLAAVATVTPLRDALTPEPELVATMLVETELRALTGPADAVFARDAIAVTRPAPYFFHVMVEEVGQAYATGAYPPPDLPRLSEALRRSRCRAVVLEPRLAAYLPAAELASIRDHYVPFDERLLDGLGVLPRRILVPGLHVDAGEARPLEVIVPGRYRVQGELRIDGRDAGAEVDVALGTHQLAAGPTGATLRLERRSGPGG